jgi:hypothetical protein
MLQYLCDGIHLCSLKRMSSHVVSPYWVGLKMLDGHMCIKPNIRCVLGRIGLGKVRISSLNYHLIFNVPPQTTKTC